MELNDRNNFKCDELSVIRKGFEKFNKWRIDEIVAAIYEWVSIDNELQNKLTEIYTKQLRKARTICQDL
jgi:hypothetical protein